MTETQSKPTRYVIQEKHLVLDNKFVILDDSDAIRYTVDSTLFALGDKLLLSDADGNELIKIRQETAHLHRTYNILSVRHDIDELHLASVKQVGLPWQHKLKIDSLKGKYVMERKGGIFSHEFTLTNDEHVVAVVTKDSSPMRCVYWVDVSNDRDEYHAFILAMVIVLSCAQTLPSNPLTTSNIDEVEV
jgi:uncharacterized protein YxjI